MTNILKAIKNIVDNPVTEVVNHYKNSNRANNMGDALEEYTKDMFSNSFNEENWKKDELYSKNFSYLWNTNNPPDLIIKWSDAIEVKKIETLSSAIALNSSFPKDKLYSSDSRITTECKNCEKDGWNEKDIIYVVWFTPKKSNQLKSLLFVYGNCYAANKEIYERISEKISLGINEIPDVELVETNELAKVKKVDPLWITDLRVRGMWHIDNPVKVFNDSLNIDNEDLFSVNAIILEEKYNSFPVLDRESIEKIKEDGFKISNIKIKSPNNPANLLSAKLITYVKKN